MKIVSGDLIKLAKQGFFEVIVHGCNCFCRMGSGIALQIKQSFPEAYKADCQTDSGDANKLGTITKAITLNGEGIPLVIVNGYTQFGYGTNQRQVDYDALRRVFREVKRQFPDKKVGYPRIGAGLAGGDWDIISQIIDGELEGVDHCLVEYN